VFYFIDLFDLVNSLSKKENQFSKKVVNSIKEESISSIKDKAVDLLVDFNQTTANFSISEEFIKGLFKVSLNLFESIDNEESIQNQLNRLAISFKESGFSTIEDFKTKQARDEVNHVFEKLDIKMLDREPLCREIAKKSILSVKDLINKNIEVLGITEIDKNKDLEERLFIIYNFLNNKKGIK